MPRRVTAPGAGSAPPSNRAPAAHRVACVLAGLLLAGIHGAARAASAASAQTTSQEGAASNTELKRMSLAQLMDVEVTSVSKEPEKLLEAAASIQVITSEEIRRSGATTLPQALRLADNLEVAQINAHDWAISARGFNTNLADKLLVLVDGRAVYTPLYGGVLWNVQDYPLADIDRIEVISGPGGTLWGANAVNGVINIITKTARETQGLYLKAASGNELKAQSTMRYGGNLGRGIYWRVYGKYTDFADEVTSTAANAGDAWHMARTGFRMDLDASRPNALTVQGDYYDGTDGTGPDGGEKVSGGNVLGHWTRTLPHGSNLSLQTYYDHAYIARPYPASPAAPPFYTGFPAADLTDDLDTFDVDFQYHFALGARQQIVWGLEYRATHEVDRDANIVRFAPAVLNQSLYSGFLQDVVHLTPSIALTLGSKLEHNDYTGYEAQPDVRLQWNLDPEQLLWAAVSRAVRTPSRYDRDLVVPTGLVNAPPPYQFPAVYLQGSGNFLSETLLAYELGYRAVLGASLSGSISAFYNVYNDLRSTSATATSAFYIFPYPYYFQNNLEGETHGLELTLTYQPLKWWRLHAGYDWLAEAIHVKPGETDTTDAINETADPPHQASLRSSMDLPHHVTLDMDLRWVDAFHIDNGPTAGPVQGIVPSYFELAARLAWHLTPRLELSLVGQNLLHPYHIEYGYPSPSRGEIGRSVFGEITWAD
jgi:iron complex outermembrane recepter protein